MNAQDLKLQLSAMVENAYKAIHGKMDELFRAGKGFEDHNDAFGKVFIVEFDEPNWIHFDRWKKIRGVAVKGTLLYIYVQDTSEGVNRDKDQFSGADYLIPFDEASFLTPHRLTEVLARLEQL